LGEVNNNLYNSDFIESEQNFYQLNLLIKNKVLVCAISDEQDIIRWAKEFKFSENIENQSESREIFHSIFQKESLFYKNYQKIIIAYHTPRFIVFEKELLSSIEEPSALLSTAIKRYPTDALFSSPLKNSQWVHLAFLPKSIQLEINLHFLEATFVSYSSALHSYYNQLNISGDIFFVALEEEETLIHYYKDGKLIFIKSFPMFYFEDMIYNIASIVNVYSLNPSSIAFNLHGKSSYSLVDLVTKLKEYYINSAILPGPSNLLSSNDSLGLYSIVKCE
jgi:hypothetical protein